MLRLPEWTGGLLVQVKETAGLGFVVTTKQNKNTPAHHKHKVSSSKKKKKKNHALNPKTNPFYESPGCEFVTSRTNNNKARDIIWKQHT